MIRNLLHELDLSRMDIHGRVAHAEHARRLVVHDNLIEFRHPFDHLVTQMRVGRNKNNNKGTLNSMSEGIARSPRSVVTSMSGTSACAPSTKRRVKTASDWPGGIKNFTSGYLRSDSDNHAREGEQARTHHLTTSARKR